MKLSLFLNQHMDEILGEWDAFAKTLTPAAEHMSGHALRDHARDILEAIALDITTRQNPEEQQQKSMGKAPAHNPQSAAAIHGTLRHASDFTLIQLSAEYRAIRATVLRLWLPHVRQMQGDTIDEMVRFNEAIDQALAESITTYSAGADRSRELFLAILGHDLRSPLATMAIAGNLLTHPQLPPEQIVPTGVRVKRSALLMNRMVDDLLGYTRTQLDSGMPIAPHDCDIREICESAVEDAHSTHQATVFKLTASGQLKGYFDDVRLHQLFTNLLVNAAQYGAKDSPVLIDASGQADGITVRVTNYGAVIPQASLQSIFKPLVQLPSEMEQDTRPRTSLGLGLFVAREITLVHGGSIDVRSNAAEGTTFTVELPRKQPC
ncbi:MAG: two-component sensor histidine kinase [Polaromonas sp.]|nr:two-component sensor histidine kinase [Polaromonas sp.]